MTLAEQYARDVDDGKIVAGKQIKLACKRFLNDLNRKDIFWDEEEAVKVTVFAERYLCLFEDQWQGKPVKILPWMAFVLQQIYGWFYQSKESEAELKKAYRDYLESNSGNEDVLTYERFCVSKSKRRIQKVFVEIAKKNAKSTLGAILSAYHLFADDRINTPKIFVGANNEEQAKICVNITGKIIEESPALAELVESGEVDLHNYRENIIGIVHRTRGGFMKAMSKETGDKTSKQSGGKHGINPSLWIIDEYGLAESDALLNTFETAQAGRWEPLGFAITTAGHNKNGPCFKKLRDAGIKVNEKTIYDDTYLAFIFEMDKDDNIQDEKNWPKCNPSLGETVQRDFLRKMLDQAVRDGGSALVDTKTFNFNQWCDTPKIWVASEIWTKNRHGYNQNDLLGKICYGGIDLGRTSDLNALGLWFPKGEGSDYMPVHSMKLLCWIPEDKILKNEDLVDYQKWIDDGWLFKTKGNVADHSVISQDIIKEVEKYQFKSLSYDKRFFVGNVLNPLQDAGIECHELAQNIATLNAPTKEFERLALSCQLENFGNPVFAWMIANAETVSDTSGNIKIDKSNGHKKIDGVSAMINALAEYKTFENENNEVQIVWV
jgi:phage terminase large subunit-like protein